MPLTSRKKHIREASKTHLWRVRIPSKWCEPCGSGSTALTTEVYILFRKQPLAILLLLTIFLNRRENYSCIQVFLYLRVSIFRHLAVETRREVCWRTVLDSAVGTGTLATLRHGVPEGTGPAGLVLEVAEIVLGEEAHEPRIDLPVVESIHSVHLGIVSVSESLIRKCLHPLVHWCCSLYKILILWRGLLECERYVQWSPRVTRFQTGLWQGY